MSQSAIPHPDFVGHERPGTNLYTGAMVVLDARTGELQWYKQAVPHDTHDWDLPVTARCSRRRSTAARRDVVTMGGKDGLLRLVDRATARNNSMRSR